MSGTFQTPSALMTNEFTDNISGLITPKFCRDAIESLAGISQTLQTTSYSVVFTDRGTVVKINSATAVNFTIPAGILSAGMIVGVRQVGAGQVTFVGTGGVTFLSSSGSVTTRAQYSLVWALADETTANLFWLDGDLT